jgi:hypothetical protein
MAGYGWHQPFYRLSGRATGNFIIENLCIQPREFLRQPFGDARELALDETLDANRPPTIEHVDALGQQRKSLFGLFDQSIGASLHRRCSSNAGPNCSTAAFGTQSFQHVDLYSPQ